MNKEDVLKEIKNTEDSIKSLSDKMEQLKAELNKPDGRGKPKDLQFYCSVDLLGDVEQNIWTDSRFDNYRYKTRNCFKTKEEAQAKADHTKTHYELMDIADELNAGQKIDWSKPIQRKYFIATEIYYGRISTDYFTVKKFPDTVYCLSEKFKNVAIERIGEYRLIKYLTYSEQ